MTKRILTLPSLEGTHVKLQDDAEAVGGEGEQHAQDGDDDGEDGVSEEGLWLVLAEEGRLEDVAGHEALDGVGQQDGEGVHSAAQVHQVIIPAVVLKHVTCRSRTREGEATAVVI